ncbi:MAG: hypothetical protein ABL904_07645 [Hyphomicrobiaceae bacterium]
MKSVPVEKVHGQRSPIIFATALDPVRFQAIARQHLLSLPHRFPLDDELAHSQATFRWLARQNLVRSQDIWSSKRRCALEIET